MEKIQKMGNVLNANPRKEDQSSGHSFELEKTSENCQKYISDSSLPSKSSVNDNDIPTVVDDKSKGVGACSKALGSEEREDSPPILHEQVEKLRVEGENVEKDNVFHKENCVQDQEKSKVDTMDVGISENILNSDKEDQSDHKMVSPNVDVDPNSNDVQNERTFRVHEKENDVLGIERAEVCEKDAVLSDKDKDVNKTVSQSRDLESSEQEVLKKCNDQDVCAVQSSSVSLNDSVCSSVEQFNSISKDIKETVSGKDEGGNNNNSSLNKKNLDFKGNLIHLEGNRSPSNAEISEKSGLSNDETSKIHSGSEYCDNNSLPIDLNSENKKTEKEGLGNNDDLEVESNIGTKSNNGDSNLDHSLPRMKSVEKEVEMNECSSVDECERSAANVSMVFQEIPQESGSPDVEDVGGETNMKDPLLDTDQDAEDNLSERPTVIAQISEKDSLLNMNKEEEDLLLNEDLDGCDQISAKDSCSDVNKEDERMLLEETEMDTQQSSAKESQEVSNQGINKNDGSNPEDSTSAVEIAVSGTVESDVCEGNEETVDKSGDKSKEKSQGETKDVSDENSGDLPDSTEFVQTDADRDENSQASQDENSCIQLEKDPIATSNEGSQNDDIVVVPGADENSMDIDEPEVNDIDGKSDDGIEGARNIDILQMCETVLEEANSEKRTNSFNDPEVIDIEEEQKDQNESSARKNKSAEKSNNSEVISNQSDICIIPDSVLRVSGKEAERKLAAGNKVRKENGGKANNKGKIVEKKSGAEMRRFQGRPQRQAAKKAESQIKELVAGELSVEEPEKPTGGFRVCDQCSKIRTWVTSCRVQEDEIEKVKYFCSVDCSNTFKRNCKSKADLESLNSEETVQFVRKCAQCTCVISGDERNLSWETMDYCNEECLGVYQQVLGSQCANCKGSVASTSLGKYCVRFGSDVRQFCCSSCLEEFKKGSKVCSFCQKDITGGSEGFLAPVGDKGQFKDFCTQLCMEKYDQMSNNQVPPAAVHICAVCNLEKVVVMEVVLKNRVNKFCGEPCFAAFKFVNAMVADQCYMCKKYFDKKESDKYSVYADNSVHGFCSKICMNLYILANRKIVPCHWCKVKKYNFDMIKRVFNSGQPLLVCSLNCLALYLSGVTTGPIKRIKCDTCGITSIANFNLNMSDGTLRNFCTYPCAAQYHAKFTTPGNAESDPVPIGCPNKFSRRSLLRLSKEPQRENVPATTSAASLPVISSVESLASGDEPVQNARSASALKPINNNKTQNDAVPSSKCLRQVIVRPPIPKQMRNKAVTCRPTMFTKGTNCRPITHIKETQTETSINNKPILIPVPVPIYVPAPMCMYSTYFPVPVPFPLPIPVPMFIPTTRNSMKGIMKEIKRIQEKIPTDPFEAELLMMAEMVAGQKKAEKCESDSDGDDNTDPTSGTGAEALDKTRGVANADGRYSPETADSNNTFGDDMLQMALKMASELDEPADLEAELTTSTITSQQGVRAGQNNLAETEDEPEAVQSASEQDTQSTKGKKRTLRTQRITSSGSSVVNAKRRRVTTTTEPPVTSSEPAQQPPVGETVEKPDANMCLKYTLGVNAWKRWVLTKNTELEKAAAGNRKLKLFKTEILQQTADELNYSLCLFVKEVRKPNGHEYAPDTIYYLCLGIQQYLFENGRIDNIFTDTYYEKFTECLDEVAKKFSSLYSDSQYIVTRVEEEHLWESKQLGAHSPHVLLSTLMFFNTKHFNLTTVDEHMQLSFSHIMKHWKRNTNQTSSKSAASSRNVLLRFYPPQAALEGNSKKKKVYEQQENEENPLRCPVKLYEFYLSKCPESVKTRSDVFYLQPERSCVPDSPVWYSTMALGKEPLMKMLHRVKMVKEINQALLKS